MTALANFRLLSDFRRPSGCVKSLPLETEIKKKKKCIWLSECNFHDQVGVILKEPLTGDTIPYLQGTLGGFLICMLR